MSLESWDAEFYPVDAAEVPEEQAIAHSLRKWQGLRPEALGRHELVVAWDALLEQGEGESAFVRINGESCALCVYFAKDCSRCPLWVVLNEHTCDGIGQPYDTWLDDGNPEPMIAALEKALEAQLC